MSDQPRQSLYGGSDTNSDGQAKPLGLMDLVSGVFSEPIETFRRLSVKPQWIGAMVLITALAMVLTIVWVARVDAPEFFRDLLERTQPQTLERLTDDALEKSAKFVMMIIVIQTLFLTPIIIFFMGLIYWAIGLASREDARWKPTYFHGLVAAAIPALVTVPYMILGTLMAFLQTVGIRRPDQIIPSSLGFWLETDNPKLSVLFGSIDLFQLLQFVMIYFAAKYALRTKTWGAALCVAVTLLLTSLRVLFAK